MANIDLQVILAFATYLLAKIQANPFQIWQVLATNQAWWKISLSVAWAHEVEACVKSLAFAKLATSRDTLNCLIFKTGLGYRPVYYCIICVYELVW